jgi:hypothetical protein
MSDWFVKNDTYDREIEHPVTKEKATVTMRPLNAGDRAEFNEIRLLYSAPDEDGGEAETEGAIRPGRMQILAVRRALVSWTIDMPITDATVQQLDPRVFDQIYGHVSFGNPKAQEVVEGTAVPLRRDAPAPAAAAAS